MQTNKLRSYGVNDQLILWIKDSLLHRSQRVKINNEFSAWHSVISGCMDTSDPRHFGPKTVRHYIFGTEMSYFFVSVPKCLWDTSLGHFGTSAEVSRTDQRRVHVLVSLHNLTSHLHHPSQSSDSVSRHFIYTKSYPDIHI